MCDESEVTILKEKNKLLEKENKRLKQNHNLHWTKIVAGCLLWLFAAIGLVLLTKNVLMKIDLGKWQAIVLVVIVVGWCGLYITTLNVFERQDDT